VNGFLFPDDIADAQGSVAAAEKSIERHRSGAFKCPYGSVKTLGLVGGSGPPKPWQKVSHAIETFQGESRIERNGVRGLEDS
jgi:hypothetical protein